MEKLQLSAQEHLRSNRHQEAQTVWCLWHIYHTNQFKKDFELALELEPDNVLVTPHLYLGKCKALVGKREAEKAIDACTKALNMDGGIFDAFMQRAEAKLLLEQYDQALQDFHKARELQPQNQQVCAGTIKLAKKN